MRLPRADTARQGKAVGDLVHRSAGQGPRLTGPHGLPGSSWHSKSQSKNSCQSTSKGCCNSRALISPPIQSQSGCFFLQLSNYRYPPQCNSTKFPTIKVWERGKSAVISLLSTFCYTASQFFSVLTHTWVYFYIFLQICYVFYFNIIAIFYRFSSVTQSCPTLCSPCPTHGLQHTRPPCPSPTPGVYTNSNPLSQWCYPTISSSVIPFSSCLQSFPAYQGLFKWVSSLHQVAKY